ncbi:hypothetical protein L596_013919 [Steinernema carpocapsae]|uniref:Gustatory receptor n=1 Tax=Steinernema carpocapsae TaxID=34508 RepID=A0A4U5P1K7_STECR|nr:hypothetical protein L596_013919 [Steinernema carpocapsae]
MPAVLESQAFTSAQEPNRLIKYVMKVQDSPHVVEHLHAYRKCVIDKHEEPEECNLLGVKKLMVFAHVFGVHPFKGTTKHRTDDCCDKGTILSKFSIFGAVLTVINFLVVVNHAQLNVVQRYLPKIRSGIFSNDASESFLQLLMQVDLLFSNKILFSRFLVAFLTLLIILFNLPSLHALLHAINSLQICNPRHQRVVLAWKIVSVSIFCIAYVFKVFGQIYGYLVLSNQSIHQLFPDWTDYNPVGKFFVFLDVIYYNLIEFPICQIPLLYLSIIALGIGLTFKENADKFKDATTMTQQSLHRFHTDLTKLSEILCLSEKCFNKLLFLTVFSSLVQIIFRTYLFCQAIRNPDSSFLFVLLNTSNLLISNVVWTFVFVLGSCVFVNETSRGGIFKITSELVDDELKPLKDQVYQKLTDYSWGFTVGKFVRIERPLILTMISLIFTIVVIWLQFSISNTSTPIAAPAVPLMPNH